jgi:thioredoxin-like negative regulator of GroEL
MSDSDHAPEALMLLGTHCPHCPVVLGALADLVKQGVIASLEVVNLEKKPDIAEQLGVRTVPWVRIGWYELEGLHSKKELLQWAEMAGTDEGAMAYFSEVLAAGQVNKVLSILKSHAELMRHMFDLLADAEAKINIRLGVGVIMEEYANTAAFAEYIPVLGELTRHADARVRSDACHYLSLTGNEAALPYINALLDDENAEVREVAEESVSEISSGS